MKLITLPATASTILLIEILDYLTPKLMVTIKKNEITMQTFKNRLKNM
jgi:hypothetical protein